MATATAIDQRTGTAAIVSIIAAIGAYILLFTGNPVWGFIAALISIPAGVIGLAMAASPRVSGGIMSIIGIVLGAIALLLTLLGMLGAIVF